MIPASNCTGTQKTQTKKAKNGKRWGKLGTIKLECTTVILKNIGPTFSRLSAFLVKVLGNS